MSNSKKASKPKVPPSVELIASPTDSLASETIPPSEAKPKLSAPKDIKPDVEAEVKRRNEDYTKGVKDGIEIAKDQLHLGQPIELIRRGAFNAGVRRMIEVAEENLAKSLSLNSRQELEKHGNLIPSWWLASLFSHVWYDELPVSSDVKQ